MFSCLRNFKAYPVPHISDRRDRKTAETVGGLHVEDICPATKRNVLSYLMVVENVD